MSWTAADNIRISGDGKGNFERNRKILVPVKIKIDKEVVHPIQNASHGAYHSPYRYAILLVVPSTILSTTFVMINLAWGIFQRVEFTGEINALF